MTFRGLYKCLVRSASLFLSFRMHEQRFGAADHRKLFGSTMHGNCLWRSASVRGTRTAASSFERGACSGGFSRVTRPYRPCIHGPDRCRSIARACTRVISLAIRPTINENERTNVRDNRVVSSRGKIWMEGNQLRTLFNPSVGSRISAFIQTLVL